MAIRRILAFDPGMNGTGWALCFKTSNGFGVTDAGIFVPDGPDVVLEQRVWHVASLAEDVIQKLRKDFKFEIAIELPKYMPSPKGQAAASGGNLVTLFMCVAGIVSATHFSGLPLNLVDVNKWKGTMSKEAVISRIRKRFKSQKMCVNFKSHEWDAVGIGLHVLGVF